RVRAGQAAAWFDKRLLVWAARSTMLVFGTRLRPPLFAPTRALNQSRSLPFRPVLSDSPRLQTSAHFLS
ncbi:hypothetical protein GY45DRAFT_1321702, partial [Cubamyces sp. BRFM 1775]